MIIQLASEFVMGYLRRISNGVGVGCLRARRQFYVAYTIEIATILAAIALSLGYGFVVYRVLLAFGIIFNLYILGVVAGDISVTSCDISNYPLDRVFGRVCVDISDSLPFEYSEQGYFFSVFFDNNVVPAIAAELDYFTYLGAFSIATAVMCVRAFTVFDRCLLPAMRQLSAVVRFCVYATYANEAALYYAILGNDPVLANYINVRSRVLVRFGLGSLLRPLGEIYGLAAIASLADSGMIDVNTDVVSVEVGGNGLDDYIPAVLMGIASCEIFVAVLLALDMGLVGAVVCCLGVAVLVCVNAPEYGVSVVAVELEVCEVLLISVAYVMDVAYLLMPGSPIVAAYFVCVVALSLSECVYRYYIALRV